ncbi:uncharacterized protein CEXT_655031 [Caerostris extrusa]|uniref:Uncharacterized protein n=1 Tax=Caerostris extrusa TaxID=172846 RepID=A0AAV4M776_CAEEX|nr:uncharacterized protein CEXT_655031 [Caerostris extrusa]
METKSQVDSPQKSPVSKTLPPTSSDTDAKKSSSNGVDGAPVDAKLESTDKPTPTTYQTLLNLNPQLQLLKNLAVTKDQTTEASKSEEKISNPIISVDIQKSMPYESKPVVPQESKQDSKSDSAAVSPEVVASVVTTAVVNEAALAISGTDGLVINGTKFSSDSSKVDSVVEQELNKISETINGKTELKSVDTVTKDCKALPNGDIDHSPVSDGTTDAASNVSKDSTTKSDVSAQNKEHQIVTEKEVVSSLKEMSSVTLAESSLSKETEQKAQSENKEQTQNIDVGPCNGVPGIITVVGITKKDSTQTTSLEKDGLTTDSKKSNEIKQSKEADNKEANKELSKDSKDDIEQKSKDGSQIVESDSKTTGIILGDEKEIDTKEKGEESSSKTESPAASLIEDNLTDSAKLQNSVHKTAEIQESASDSQEKKDSSKKENEKTEISGTKSDVTKPQEKTIAETFSKEQTLKDTDKISVDKSDTKGDIVSNDLVTQETSKKSDKQETTAVKDSAKDEKQDVQKESNKDKKKKNPLKRL